MVDISNPLFSTTDASNNANSPNGYNSTTTPANVQAIEQALRGALKRVYERSGPSLTTSGSSNAYVVTPTNTSYPSALVQGDVYCQIANFTNTGAATLAYNGLSAVAIKKNSSTGLVALVGGEIQSGASFIVLYNGSSFELVNPVPTSTTGYLALSGGSMSGAINLAQGANIASASTTAIGAATGNLVNITGTTNISAFDTVQAGTERQLVFQGILTVVYNATSLILPGPASITVAVGDTMRMISLGSGNWKCIDYTPVASPASSLSTNGYKTLPAFPGDPNPIIYQWGTTASINSGVSLIVSFPKQYPNNCFSVVAISGVADTVATSNNCLNTITTSNFNMINKQGNTTYFTWMAVGN